MLVEGLAAVAERRRPLVPTYIDFPSRGSGFAARAFERYPRAIASIHAEVFRYHGKSSTP